MMQKMIKRRDILRCCGLLGGALIAPIPIRAFASNFNSTPSQVEGPFYPIKFPGDQDFDLTQFGLQSETAQGDIIDLNGQVFNLDGLPLQGAKVEIWQADIYGRYNHPADNQNRKVDLNFQGYGKVLTDQSGGYRFLTIKPGSYDVGGGWQRPPHIHFKVSYKTYPSLTTQMYFFGDPLNKVDHLLNSVDQPNSLIVKFSSLRKKSGLLRKGVFNIYLPVS